MVVITLVGKPGCHLCDDARTVIVDVVDDLVRTGAEIEFEERSILDDPVLRDRYAEEIPVVLVDGAMHAYWRVDPARLRAVLTR